ncbi:hypothetical protein SDAV_003120 (plasmid) [Spiroplasma phoeniceum P40]|uniref:Uncharacterized protein n=2 Tax=Spiroplasma phoeniceum TaxID=47835 RepID=A0A345DSW7_9MOLU|nr:hypothetical protein SDAV_003107 [Spiroplasma phoeniceum P40]AXF97308.1 hypothetical protein SDAV_003120 [Spiroplasma phoeniceum P40]
MKKVDENICLVPYCQENNSIIEIDSPFCIEHSEKFKDFAKNYDGRNQIKNMLRTDIKLSNELIINMISCFCDEEENKYQQLRMN